MTYAAAVLADSPDFYFRLEEPSGAFADSSGHGVTLTEHGGSVTRSVAGAVSGGVGITGSGSVYLDTSFSASLVQGQTVEGWFKTTSSGTLKIFNGRLPSDGMGLNLYIGSTGFGASAGQVTANFNATLYWQGVHTTATVNDGVWHHIAATWAASSGVSVSPSQILIYIDGALASTTADSGNTGGPLSSPLSSGIYRLVDLAALSCDEMAYYSSALSAGRIAAHVAEADPFTADFSGDPQNGAAPLSVDFTDESYGGTGTPDSWAWDFGDGNHSTAQDPTHVYAFEGLYTVSLTVGTDDAETDTETRSAYIEVALVYVPPLPGAALIEIRAAAVGAARWGVAHWGEDVWASAGWVDVTPQSVDARVMWGSHDPGAGILTKTEAATWEVTTYDPERLLDPGNASSPYHADLRAGLPIRIRHRGTIIRQGICETIAYYHSGDVGGIRVTDNLSLLARTDVPDDTTLPNTLRARARAAIAAAGLRLSVESDPPTGDPAVAPRLEGVQSVWRHVDDAAEQTLHIAYIDRLGTLMFRPWATPYDRTRGVDATQLIELGTIIQTAGLYSVVRALQTVADGGATIERRLTPAPRYGAIEYERPDPTIDAGAWADAVLADRSLQTVQYIPGEIYPLTADDVEYFATLQAIERFGVDHATADPPVDVTGVIVGGTIRLTAKKDSEALWRFELELAQTADAPLYFDSDPPQFMLNDPGDGYLYGD